VSSTRLSRMLMSFSCASPLTGLRARICITWRTWASSECRDCLSHLPRGSPDATKRNERGLTQSALLRLVRRTAPRTTLHTRWAVELD
jgi:hypothetical protein